MGNLFDSAAYPKQEPQTLEAGDLWGWQRPDLLTDYPSSAYSLSYILRREITGQLIAITADSDYIVSVAATVTADYAPGRYHWEALITRTSDSARVTVNSGTLEVRPDRATSSDDPRSFAQICLDNIETYLRDPNNIAAASYSIAGRSLSRWSRTDLLTERDRWKGEVAREKQAEDFKRGRLTNSTIRVRFT